MILVVNKSIYSDNIDGIPMAFMNVSAPAKVSYIFSAILSSKSELLDLPEK